MFCFFFIVDEKVDAACVMSANPVKANVAPLPPLAGTESEETPLRSPTGREKSPFGDFHLQPMPGKLVNTI